MKLLDRLCAGTLFILAIVDCWLVPRTYTGRIWILGTALALLFTAMLNSLRIRNGYAVRGLKMSCIAANILMFTFVLALIAEHRRGAHAAQSANIARSDLDQH